MANLRSFLSGIARRLTPQPRPVTAKADIPRRAVPSHSDLNETQRHTTRRTATRVAVRPAGPTWRSSATSGDPFTDRPPLASPRPKNSLLLITLRDSGSRIGTRYPRTVWSAAALPREEEGSETADSVTLLWSQQRLGLSQIDQKMLGSTPGDGKDAETALSSRNFPRIMIGRCRVRCWFVGLYARRTTPRFS